MLVIIASLSFLVRIWFPFSWDILNMKPAYFPQYILPFVVGIWAARNDFFLNLPGKIGRLWLRLALFAGIPFWFVMMVNGKLMEALPVSFLAGRAIRRVPFMLNRLQELEREATVKQALFRTTQEALNNVLQHAGVNAAAIDLIFGEKEVILRMSDRGCGFVPGEIPTGESVGLINMRERVEAVGREFLIRTAAGGGTEIEARVPCNRGGQA